jgi:hypothetical protein
LSREASPAPPFASYAAILSTFVGGVALASVLSGRLGRRVLDRRVLDQRPFDLAVLGLATFKAARTLAHDDVTSFIRKPFVVGEPTDPAGEQPVADGSMRQAIGELVTCSRCVGTWIAAGIAAIDALGPRCGRMLTWSLAVGGANDWLQALFSALTAAANRLESS